jgi:hypothetical protein
MHGNKLCAHLGKNLYIFHLCDCRYVYVENHSRCTRAATRRIICPLYIRLHTHRLRDIAEVSIAKVHFNLLKHFGASLIGKSYTVCSLHSLLHESI